MTQQDRNYYKFARDKGYFQDRRGWEHYAIGRKILAEADNPSKACYDLLAERRLELRRPYKKQEDDWKNVPLPDEVVIADGGQLDKIRFDHNLTDEEWEFYKDEFWVDWYNPYEDGRDCTGVRFTCWMQLFNLKDGTAWIYHRTALDI